MHTKGGRKKITKGRRPESTHKGAKAEGVVRKPLTVRWSSTTLFVLAASGAAIGFNNFWQFPFLAGQYGGGAFVIAYLFFVLLIGLPLLMAEVMLGRMGRGSPICTLSRLARRARGDPKWVLVGWFAVLGSFLIFSYLSVIAGWTIAYTLRSAFGVFVGQTADGISSLFTALAWDPEKQLFWHSVFILMTMVTAARGVRAGLEVVIKYAVPLLFILLLILMAYAAATEAFGRALVYLFQPDFTKLSGAGILTALGHAFFSLGLGVGVMLMYGAYLNGEVSIHRVALTVVGLDTAVALMAGVVVFSLLFSGDVEPASGPTLVFQAMPLAFDHIPFGHFFGTVFFGLLVIIAWMTGIALVEPVMAWLGERFDMNRFKAAMVSGAVAWTLGLITILSFNHWKFEFKFLGVVKKLGFFDVLQIFTAQVLLPLGGIFIALFAGWVLKPAMMREQFAMRSPCAFDIWLWLVRLVIPVLLLMLFFNIMQLFS